MELQVWSELLRWGDNCRVLNAIEIGMSPLGDAPAAVFLIG